MSVINAKTLLMLRPIKDMVDSKKVMFGASFGLSEAGYDIRIKQDIIFYPRAARTWKEGVLDWFGMKHYSILVDGVAHDGRFTLASAIEEFDMPPNLVGEVKDKSTWARRGLSVFNTVIEPGWKGFLTLELVFHGSEPVHIMAGSGIAQVIFSELEHDADYGNGKYQNAADRPQEAIMLDSYQVPIKT